MSYPVRDLNITSEEENDLLVEIGSKTMLDSEEHAGTSQICTELEDPLFSHQSFQPKIKLTELPLAQQLELQENLKSLKNSVNDEATLNKALKILSDKLNIAFSSLQFGCLKKKDGKMMEFLDTDIEKISYVIRQFKLNKTNNQNTLLTEVLDVAKKIGINLSKENIEHIVTQLKCDQKRDKSHTNLKLLKRFIKELIKNNTYVSAGALSTIINADNNVNKLIDWEFIYKFVKYHRYLVNFINTTINKTDPSFLKTVDELLTYNCMLCHFYDKHFEYLTINDNSYDKSVHDDNYTINSDDKSVHDDNDTINDFSTTDDVNRDPESMDTRGDIMDEMLKKCCISKSLVYTTKLDDMKILNQDTGKQCMKDVLTRIEAQSKPIFLNTKTSNAFYESTSFQSLVNKIQNLNDNNTNIDTHSSPLLGTNKLTEKHTLDERSMLLLKSCKPLFIVLERLEEHQIRRKYSRGQTDNFDIVVDLTIDQEVENPAKEEVKFIVQVEHEMGQTKSIKRKSPIDAGKEISKKRIKGEDQHDQSDNPLVFLFSNIYCRENSLFIIDKNGSLKEYHKLQYFKLPSANNRFLKYETSAYTSLKTVLSVKNCCWHHRAKNVIKLQNSYNLQSCAALLRSTHQCPANFCKCCCNDFGALGLDYDIFPNCLAMTKASQETYSNQAHKVNENDVSKTLLKKAMEHAVTKQTEHVVKQNLKCKINKEPMAFWFPVEYESTLEVYYTDQSGDIKSFVKIPYNCPNYLARSNAIFKSIKIKLISHILCCWAQREIAVRTFSNDISVDSVSFIRKVHQCSTFCSCCCYSKLLSLRHKSKIQSLDSSVESPAAVVVASTSLAGHSKSDVAIISNAPILINSPQVSQILDPILEMPFQHQMVVPDKFKMPKITSITHAGSSDSLLLTPTVNPKKHSIDPIIIPEDCSNQTQRKSKTVSSLTTSLNASASTPVANCRTLVAPSPSGSKSSVEYEKFVSCNSTSNRTLTQYRIGEELRIRSAHEVNLLNYLNNETLSPQQTVKLTKLVPDIMQRLQKIHLKCTSQGKVNAALPDSIDKLTTIELKVIAHTILHVQTHWASFDFVLNSSLPLLDAIGTMPEPKRNAFLNINSTDIDNFIESQNVCIKSSNGNKNISENEILQNKIKDGCILPVKGNEKTSPSSSKLDNDTKSSIEALKNCVNETKANSKNLLEWGNLIKARSDNYKLSANNFLNTSKYRRTRRELDSTQMSELDSTQIKRHRKSTGTWRELDSTQMRELNSTQIKNPRKNKAKNVPKPDQVYKSQSLSKGDQALKGHISTSQSCAKTSQNLITIYPSHLMSLPTNSINQSSDSNIKPMHDTQNITEKVTLPIKRVQQIAVVSPLPITASSQKSNTNYFLKTPDFAAALLSLSKPPSSQVSVKNQGNPLLRSVLTKPSVPPNVTHIPVQKRSNALLKSVLSKPSVLPNLGTLLANFEIIHNQVPTTMTANATAEENEKNQINSTPSVKENDYANKEEFIIISKEPEDNGNIKKDVNIKKEIKLNEKDIKDDETVKNKICLINKNLEQYENIVDKTQMDPIKIEDDEMEPLVYDLDSEEEN